MRLEEDILGRNGLYGRKWTIWTKWTEVDINRQGRLFVHLRPLRPYSPYSPFSSTP